MVAIGGSSVGGSSVVAVGSSDGHSRTSHSGVWSWVEMNPVQTLYGLPSTHIHEHAAIALGAPATIAARHRAIIEQSLINGFFRNILDNLLYNNFLQHLLQNVGLTINPR
jgi:hypothetical protein